MSVDFYKGSARRWAQGATIVYGPIALAMLEMSPHSLDGRTVLDAGAGTGVASQALERVGARTLSTDASYDMLAWDAPSRPPCVVADIRALPLSSHCVDDTVAGFVLNHLVDPAAGLQELTRVTRRRGAILATVYSNSSRSAVRDRVDEVALDAGWQVPAWYCHIKASATPLLGSPDAMRAAADHAGLECIRVEERPVDVGVTEPEQLVDYRFGQAQFASWLDGIGVAQANRLRRRAVDAIRGEMKPYRPTVVFLAASTP